MLRHMRTTINLPDALARTAKAKAAAEGRTFTSLVEEGLRLVIDVDRDEERARPQLPAYGNADASFLVDPLDREAVWAALDADGPR